MLSRLKKIFDVSHTQQDTTPDHDHRLKLATAALMIEMMHQDAHIKPEEIATVKGVLVQKFMLDEAETHELYASAEQELKQSTDYHQFTHLIARNYSVEEKTRVIEYLWMVALADHHLDKYEEHMVRRIADLIHLPHRYFIATKHRALEQQGRGSPQHKNS